MESADAAMAELYNYETDDGESLAAVLKNSNLTDGERSLEVDEALKEVMSKSKHIASTRFVDINGKIYSVYYNQEKHYEMTHNIIRRWELSHRMRCAIYVYSGQRKKVISVSTRMISSLYLCAIIWILPP